MTKEIIIDGKKVKFKCSAATAWLYRERYKRDLIKDFSNLSKRLEKGGNIPIEALEIFERLAYIMARQANPSIPNTEEKWLDNFESFSIYDIMPTIMELWQKDKKTTVKPKNRGVQ